MSPPNQPPNSQNPAFHLNLSPGMKLFHSWQNDLDGKHNRDGAIVISRDTLITLYDPEKFRYMSWGTSFLTTLLQGYDPRFQDEIVVEGQPPISVPSSIERRPYGARKFSL